MKEKIKGMIQENLQMIEILNKQVKMLRELVGENFSDSQNDMEVLSENNDVAKKIKAYRENLMRDIERSLPNVKQMSGLSPMGGMGIAGVPEMNGMPNIEDMRKKFESMKKEMEKNSKE